MLKQYSCWQLNASNQKYPDLHFQPGVTLYECEENQGWSLKYIIQAETWEEAMAIHYLREGWDPYIPRQSEMKECPNCQSSYIYASEECHCGYHGRRNGGN